MIETLRQEKQQQEIDILASRKSLTNKHFLPNVLKVVMMILSYTLDFQITVHSKLYMTIFVPHVKD